jgi:hypothetical protein
MIKEYKMSEEHRKKISVAHTGMRPSDLTREKMRLQRLGKKLSKETREKISIANKGRTSNIMTDDIRRKISLKNKGKHYSPATQFKKGHKISEETKKKIIASLTGRKVSQETREKISKSNIGKKHKPHTDEWKKQNSLRHTGKVNSMESRKKMSITKMGKLNPNWKGGISPINTSIRMSMEYKLWRKSVFERDNYTCVWCGTKQGWNKITKKQNIIQADHIKPFCNYPELRFAIDNGRTLCDVCHKTTETYGAKKQVDI